MIVFCEYKVLDAHRQTFLEWVRADAERFKGGRLMESADQPGVFVEIWTASNAAEASRIRKERLEGRSGWKEMESWIQGGSQGLRIWTFRSVNPGG